MCLKLNKDVTKKWENREIYNQKSCDPIYFKKCNYFYNTKISEYPVFYYSLSQDLKIAKCASLFKDKPNNTIYVSALGIVFTKTLASFFYMTQFMYRFIT